MNPVLPFRCLCLVALTLLTAPAAWAQPPPSRSESTQPQQVGPVREAGPKVYHLLDQDGNPILVPDFTFEKYERWIQLERDLLPAPPPGYEFSDEILMAGTVHDGYAALEVTIPIRLTELDAAAERSWVRVPLRLNQAIRAPRIQYEGPGEAPRVTYSDEDGHVAWFRSEPGTEHKLMLNVRVPLERAGIETRFFLLSPAGTCRTELSVPGTDLKASLIEGSQGIPSVEPGGVDRTKVVVSSMGGEIRVAWSQQGEAPAVLEAEGTITVRLDGGQLDCDAKLRVRSHGSPLESLLVRLPPNMDPIPVDSRDNLIQVNVEGLGSEAGGKIVRVHRRDGRAANEFDVLLRTMRPPSLLPPSEAEIEVGGFEVLGAVRQSGTVEFELQGDWNVDFTAGAHVRQVAQYTEALPQRNIAARFVYNRQPFTLRVGLRAKESRVNVEPSFVVFVEADHARLEGRLAYKVSGARARQLELDFGGWQVEGVAPLELVSQSDLDLGQASPLQIPLDSGTPTFPGEFEVQITAHRPVVEGEPFSFVLPRALESTSSSATLVVVPADNVQLAPRSEEIQGLLSESLPREMQLPQRQQLPLFYREDSSAEASTFAADLQIRQRSVKVAVETQLRFAERRIDVQQRFRCHVEYEPISELQLALPALLADADALEVTRSDKPLTLRLVEPPAPATVEPDQQLPRTAVVDLREDCIGDCEFVLRYVVPADYASPGDVPETVVPLIQPVEDEQTVVEQHVLRLESGENLQVQLVGEDWSPLAPESGNGVAGAGLAYEAKGGLADAVTLSALVDRSSRQTTTRLQRVWIQTWLTRSVRRDRVTLQMTTNEDRVQIQLPPGVLSEDVQVLVAGQDWDRFVTRSSNQIDIELTANGTARDYTIELWYWFEAQEWLFGRIPVALPKVVATQNAQRLYWQLVVPGDEHLLWTPKSLTAEYQWQWSEYHWGRRPNLSQQDLESRMAASTQEDLPAARNVYLFSSVGPLTAVEFHTAKRMAFVLGVSGVILLAGLLLIYVPVLRHPAVLLAGGVGVLAVGSVFPEPAVLAAQAALFGLALVLLARVLQWSLARRRYRLVPVPGMVTPVSESQRSEVSLAAQEGSARLPSTITPGSYRVPAADSEA